MSQSRAAVGPFWSDSRGVEYGYRYQDQGTTIQLRYPKEPKGKAAVKAHKRARRKAREAERRHEAMEGPQ